MVDQDLIEAARDGETEAVRSLLEQATDDLDVTPIRGADETGPVVAVLRVHVGAGVERELEQRRVVPHLARGDQIGALLRRILHVDIGAGVHERARYLDVISVRRGD